MSAQLIQIHDLQESINETAEQRTEEQAEAEKREEQAQYGSLTELFNEIRSYYWDHVHLMVEVEYDILTAWTLTTWIPEKLKECAYTMFRGPKNSGKTRALNTQARLTYNAEKTSKITIAALYRLLEKGIYTFIMDEFDHYSREKREDLIAILNAGYKRGDYIIICDPDDKNEVKKYPCFGPKSLALIKDTDAAFTSRCIIFNMARNTRPVKFEFDEQTAFTLRLKLGNYRDNMKDVELESQKENLYDYGIKDGRLIELYNGIIAVTPKEKRHSILEYAKAQYEDLIDAEAASLYKEVYEAIKTCINTTTTPGKISVECVANQLNLTRKEDEKFSNRKVGALLNTLALKNSVTLHSNKRGRKIKRHIMERLDNIYGDPQKTIEGCFNERSG